MVVAERRRFFLDGDIEMPPAEPAEGGQPEQQQLANGHSLFGFENQPFDPLVTSALGHRVSQMQNNVEDAMAHHQFTADLIEHVWSLRDVGTV